jgi:hypothetical protein
MTTSTDLMSSMHEQGAFFDVYEDTVVSGSGTPFVGKKMICRKDTGEGLGIVSKKYRTVTSEEQFSRFGEALERSNLDLTDATARVDFANGGARTMVRFTFPAVSLTVRDDDQSVLEIVTKNSYDGRWKFSVRGGAVRIACLNGQLFGDWLASYDEYHNQKLNVEHAADKVVEIVDGFADAEGRWNQMLRSPITDEKAWRVICKYSRNEAGFKAGLGAFRDAPRKTVATSMMEQYETKERPSIGQNAFAVYNTLTHHATHAALRDGKAAISRDLRAKQVADVLASKYWNERVLCAA